MARGTNGKRDMNRERTLNHTDTQTRHHERLLAEPLTPGHVEVDESLLHERIVACDWMYVSEHHLGEHRSGGTMRMRADINE